MRSKSEDNGAGGRSRRSSRGSSRRRRNVEDEVLLVSYPNRCVLLTYLKFKLSNTF